MAGLGNATNTSEGKEGGRKSQGHRDSTGSGIWGEKAGKGKRLPG